MTGQRAVFLDRDGVINRVTVVDGKSYPPQRLEEFRLIEGVSEACSIIERAGFHLIVVTNQPDVATGKQRQTEVEAMHAHLARLLPVDDIFVCYHVDDDGCACRKPKPGMLIRAAAKHNIDLGQSYLVGDRWRDIAAGQAAGCHSFFIDYGYAEPRPVGTFTAVDSLLAASLLIGGTVAQ